MARRQLESEGKRDLGMAEDVIVEAVRESLDLSDKIVRHAFADFVKEWKTRTESAARLDDTDIVHRIASEASLKAIVYWLAAQVKRGAAKRAERLAEEKAEIAARQVIQIIHECEDVDSEGDWSLDIYRLALVKKDSLEQEAALSKLIEAVKEMTKEDKAELASVRDGNLPDNLREALQTLNIAPDFAKDLADIFLETGEKGRELAARVCDDVEVTFETLKDPDCLMPLRFLAAKVFEYQKLKEN